MEYAFCPITGYPGNFHFSGAARVKIIVVRYRKIDCVAFSKAYFFAHYQVSSAIRQTNVDAFVIAIILPAAAGGMRELAVKSFPSILARMVQPPLFERIVPGLAASIAFFSAIACCLAVCWLLQELTKNNKPSDIIQIFITGLFSEFFLYGGIAVLIVLFAAPPGIAGNRSMNARHKRVLQPLLNLFQ